MKWLHEVSEAAMVAAWVKAEARSPEFSQSLLAALGRTGMGMEVVLKPNLSCPHENKARAKVLQIHRGYGRNAGIFEGIPAKLTWYEVVFPLNEIPGLRYYDSDQWREFAGPERRVGDMITRLRNGQLPPELTESSIVKAIHEIKWGAVYDKGPLIFWGRNNREPFDQLEGHHRLTSLAWHAMNGATNPAEIPAIVGLIEPVPVSELALVIPLHHAHSPDMTVAA